MITSAQYDAVQRNASAISAHLASELGLRPKQQQALFNLLVNSASSEYLREMATAYLKGAAGWGKS